jgi:MSHA biogenesis protein MshG
MPAYAYLARGPEGQKIEGVIDMPDAGTLAESLAAQGLLLVRAEPRAVASEALAVVRVRLFEPAVTSVDLLLFCRQMATLLKAGVPLLRALKSLEESATNRRFARVLADLRQQLESGRELSVALRAHDRVFTPFVVSMVRVGELTGRLPEVFDGLYRQIGFTRDSREQVRSALRYPTFVLAVALAALIAVNVFVIPSFARVYQGLNAELPALTQVLIGVSSFLQTWWPAMLALAAATAVWASAALRTRAGRRVRDQWLLRLPIVGALVHKAALARFTRSFALAMDAGVPVVDALGAAAETADNLVLGDRIATMRIAAERGESLARAARGTGVFTPTVIQMVAIGEETGALAEMMNEVADHYQKEVDYAVKALAAQIEPILVIVLGALILVFALGVFLPLWDLSRVAIR